MDALYSFYPFLHLRLFLCMFFSLLSLSLSHVTNIMVLYIASSSLFLFLNNTILLDVSRCLRLAIIEVMARRKKNINSISYGQFA